MIQKKYDAIPQGRIHQTKGAMQDPLYEIMTSGDSTITSLKMKHRKSYKTEHNTTIT
jgi:hypothetical protein